MMIIIIIEVDATASFNPLTHTMHTSYAIAGTEVHTLVYTRYGQSPY